MQQLPTPSSSGGSSCSPQIQPQSATTLSTPSDFSSFCWQFLDCMNARDFSCSHLLDRFSPNFTAYAPGKLPCNSVTELLANRQAVVCKFPEMQLVFISADTEIREETGFAETHLFTEIMGMPPGVRRQVLNVFRWRRVKDKVNVERWVVVEFTFLARQPVEEGVGG